MHRLSMGHRAVLIFLVQYLGPFVSGASKLPRAFVGNTGQREPEWARSNDNVKKKERAGRSPLPLGTVTENQ